MTMIQDADVAPTSSMTATAAQLHALAPRVLQKWHEFQQQDLPKFNDQLKSGNLPQLNAAQRGRNAEVEMRGNEE